jgi:hypothetical protein
MRSKEIGRGIWRAVTGRVADGDEPPGAWPQQAPHRRVLVESADPAVRWAIANLLKEAGFSVITCGGPQSLAHAQCSLIADGDCGAAAGADVIFHRLNPSHLGERKVLEALRQAYPDKPIVVEIPRPSAGKFAELLKGCQVIYMPATRASITAALAG